MDRNSTCCSLNSNQLVSCPPLFIYKSPVEGPLLPPVDMSASGDFGPAPPGVDLSESQNGRMYGGVITLMVLGTLAVALRVYARSKTKLRFAVDDYLIFVALVSRCGVNRLSRVHANQLLL